MKKILLAIGIIFLVVGCSNKIDGEAIYKTIDLELAKEFVTNEKALLIDTRSYEDFTKEHIEGAINMPANEITKESIKNVTNSKIDNIIVYCGGDTDCKSIAIKIIEFGYTNVYDLGNTVSLGANNAQ